MDEFNPFEAMKNIPESTGEKGTPHQGTYIYASPDFNGTFPVLFHEPKSDKLIELEGTKVETGPNGKPVVTRRPYQYFEDNQPIDKKQIKAVLRYEDGSEDPFFNLKRTRTFNIKEGRPMSDVTLDPADMTKSYGTTIPRSDVDRYLVERMQEEWEPVHAGLKSLLEHLEKTRQAALYPFSFGNGRKLYECIAYPVRIEGKLFMLKRYCSGQLIYSHPLEAPADAGQQTAAVEVPVVRIRNKAKQSAL